jgi:uncharacterized SAM-binding protein YcdF (DUF218 family)
VGDVPEGGGGRVVAVLGYSGRRGRGLHPVCAARLARAEELAEGARAVILSGWARHPHATAEAELMRAAWRGPAVPLLSDPDASSTAGNAANIAADVRALDADELVVVTSSWHAPRARALVAAALRAEDVRVSVEPAGSRPSPRIVVRELACLVALPLQLGRARRRVPSFEAERVPWFSEP